MSMPEDQNFMCVLQYAEHHLQYYTKIYTFKNTINKTLLREKSFHKAVNLKSLFRTGRPKKDQKVKKVK
jgi:hypothetical protein